MHPFSTHLITTHHTVLFWVFSSVLIRIGPCTKIKSEILISFHNNWTNFHYRSKSKSHEIFYFNIPPWLTTDFVGPYLAGVLKWNYLFLPILPRAMRNIMMIPRTISRFSWNDICPYRYRINTMVTISNPIHLQHLLFVGCGSRPGSSSGKPEEPKTDNSPFNWHIRDAFRPWKENRERDTQIT